MSKVDKAHLLSILESASIINLNISIEQLLPLIMLKAKELLQADASSLFLWDEDESFLFCETALGEGGETLREFLRLELGQGIAGWVAEHRTPVLLEDAYADDRFDPSWDQKTGYKTRSVICVPLERNGRLIGTLQVFNRFDGESFDPVDLEILQAQASIASIAIHNNQLHESLQKRVLELTLLYEFELEISRNFDLENLSHWLLDRCLQVMESKIGSLLIYDPAEKSLRIIAARGLSKNLVSSIRIKPGEGVSGWVAANKQPLLVRDIEQDPRFPNTGSNRYENSSFISAPIMFQDDLLGVININNKLSGYTYNKNDLKVITTVANRLAFAIKNSQLSARVTHNIEETERARRLLNSILPSTLPAEPRLMIDIDYRLIDTIGGDFYKFFQLGDGKLGIFIADVCGHGLSAALLAMMVHTVLSSFEQKLLESPAEMFSQLNRLLVSLLNGNFLTAFYGVFDLDNHCLVYGNAGHPNPIMIKKSGELLSLKARGSILGVFQEIIFEEREIEFAEGDSLFTYTDGLVECLDNEGVHILEDQGLISLVREVAHEKGRFLDQISQLTSRHFNRKNFEDDITLLFISRLAD